MGFKVRRRPALPIHRIHRIALIRSTPCSLFVQVWYDNRAEDLTKEGMLKGIEEAACFLLFLSEGVLQRPYCQLEIRQAVGLNKPIVLLHGEIDETHECHEPSR